MEREEMIEEMASCFCGYYDDKNGKCKLYLHRPLCKDLDKNCIYRRKATSIVNKYIPEGAVVLTKDEYDKLNRRIAFGITYDEEKLKEFVDEAISNVQIQIDEIRKETARDILKQVKSFLDMQTKTIVDLSKGESRFAIPENCKECYIGSQ